jgi:PAS domain S-box-containing protein
MQDMSRDLGEENKSAQHPATESEATVAGRLERERLAHAATRRTLAETEEELRRKTEVCAELERRFETALRGSNVAVFKQDAALRYLSVSKPVFRRTVEEMVGSSDGELLGPRVVAALTELKREVLTTGRSVHAELRLSDGEAGFWYDFHLEPVRDDAGKVEGLTGTAADITERKDNETHLRLLMRELTHRSKNLLAVIQAMARQTARHAGTIDTFLDRFGARLQALARSHDLLAAASWHGVSLGELVRSQIAPYVEYRPERVAIEGPDLYLRPEATQSLGLALHELAANAAKHGALARARGRVSITWRRLDGGVVELVWQEAGGSKVGAPKRRGFGTVAIQDNLARVLQAEVDVAFPPSGLICRVLAPESRLIAQV